MNLFFPGDEDDADWYDTNAATALEFCRRCTVRKECFAFALDDPDSIANGVYGGTTPKDRARYLEAISIRGGHHPSGH